MRYPGDTTQPSILWPQFIGDEGSSTNLYTIEFQFPLVYEGWGEVEIEVIVDLLATPPRDGVVDRVW